MIKSKFKQFISEGIEHIEDMQIEHFLKMLKNINKLVVTQKLDGSALSVGFDNGRFYTSRENKGGKKYYAVEEYPNSSAFDGFKSAHTALETIKDSIIKVGSENCKIDCEILFGPQPNAIVYSKKIKNKIVFLRSLDTDNKNFIDDLLDEITDKVVVKSIISSTTDGIEIKQEEKEVEWHFDKVKVIDKSGLDVKPLFKELNDYLKEPNEIGSDTLGSEKTNYEVLQDRSRDLTTERNNIRDRIINDFKIPIKNSILKSLMPKLKGDQEGLVFSDPETLEQFKVIDRDVFSIINKFNYDVRKNVSGRTVSTDAESSLEAKGGILGNVKLRIYKLFDVEGLDHPQKAKNVLKKFKKDTPKETVYAFADNLKNLSFQSVRKKIEAIMIEGLNELESSLQNFKENKDDYEVELSNGKKVKYSEEVINRTLLSFAETRKNLIEQLTLIKEAKSMPKLIAVLFGSKIKQIHQENP